MLFIENNELTPISEGPALKCPACGVRRATWMGCAKGESKPRPWCGWCVLYDPTNAWGHERRDEISHVGVLCRSSALKARGKNTIVPELDERHRLQPGDAERFMLGVGFTSGMVRANFKRIARMRDPA